MGRTLSPKRTLCLMAISFNPMISIVWLLARHLRFDGRALPPENGELDA